MTLPEFLEAIAQLSGLLFVVTSMLAMGLSLTMTQILQPLKNARLVILALLANFVLVPLLAYGILRVIPLEQTLQIGLIVLACAAGAADPPPRGISESVGHRQVTDRADAGTAGHRLVDPLRLR